MVFLIPIYRYVWQEGETPAVANDLWHLEPLLSQGQVTQSHYHCILTWSRSFQVNFTFKVKLYLHRTRKFFQVTQKCFLIESASDHLSLRRLEKDWESRRKVRYKKRCLTECARSPIKNLTLHFAVFSSNIKVRCIKYDVYAYRNERYGFSLNK